MIEFVILGIVQGVVDWLPVSSQGVLTLVQLIFFDPDRGIVDITKLALFLHTGSLLAVVVYFRADMAGLIKGLIRFNRSDRETKSLLVFLFVSTLVTGIIGVLILLSLEELEPVVKEYGLGYVVMLAVGALLLVTSFLQWRSPKRGTKGVGQLSLFDGVLLGAVQGFAVLPGLSRSGTTVSVLLMRRFQESEALRLSFFMSVPVVFGANVVLNLDSFFWNWGAMAGLLAAFGVGLLTIHFLLHLAERLSFHWFTLGFGLLVIALAIFQILFGY